MSASSEPIDSKQENPSAPGVETELPAGAAQGDAPPFDAQDATDDTDAVALLAQAQEQVAQYHEELLRAKAEAENIRRRAVEDVAKARKFGIESFAESLVAVKDSLEAALSQPEQSQQAWKEGVEVTLRQLSAAFERNALKDVAPAAGDKFDPHLHQAISSVPSDHPEGCVAQTLQKGYTIADRVLRPALVMVSSGQKAA